MHKLSFFTRCIVKLVNRYTSGRQKFLVCGAEVICLYTCNMQKYPCLLPLHEWINENESYADSKYTYN